MYVGLLCRSKKKINRGAAAFSQAPFSLPADFPESLIKGNCSVQPIMCILRKLPNDDDDDDDV